MAHFTVQCTDSTQRDVQAQRVSQIGPRLVLGDR